MPRQNQVPDEDPALQHAVPVQAVCPALPHHFVDGRGCGLRIISRGGIAPGGFRAEVLEIRHVNLHQTVQQAERLDAFISGTVPDHGNPEIQAFQRLRDHAGKVRRRDKLDVMHALIPQALHQRTEFGNGKRLSDAFSADFTVLTENTAEITA